MKTYKVVSGDTLWDIAINNGIELDELLKANPKITNPNLIYKDQIINIPSTDSSTYIVVKGDTLSDIAIKKGIELDELLKANPKITNSNLIYIGQTINIPSVTESPNIPSSDIRKLEAEVIRLVNVERARIGRPALVENNSLSNIARIKSKDFVNNNYFSHNSPTYGSPFDMIKSFGINFSAAAENIAGGQRTAAEVMNTWMNSLGHRTNILNPIYNQIGVGVARDNNGNLLWTQMFIRS